jgi:hypothetical protein
MDIHLYDINNKLKSSYKFSIDAVSPVKNITTKDNIISGNTVFTNGGIAGIIIASIVVIIGVVVIIKCYRKYKWCQKMVDMDKQNH